MCSVNIANTCIHAHWYEKIRKYVAVYTSIECASYKYHIAFTILYIAFHVNNLHTHTPLHNIPVHLWQQLQVPN